METFWISFRIADTNTYNDRYEALIETIRSVASKWWLEPSSFIVFSSSQKIDNIAASLKEAIDPEIDLAILGMPDYKSVRLVGLTEDPDIFKLIPFAKKV